MKEVYQKPPMVTYRRPPNLRDKLIRARIPDPPRMRPKRLRPGMKPYGLNCPTCPFIEPGTVIQSSNSSKKIEINGTFNCKTRNVICTSFNSKNLILPLSLSYNKTIIFFLKVLKKGSRDKLILFSQMFQSNFSVFFKFFIFKGGVFSTKNANPWILSINEEVQD